MIDRAGATLRVIERPVTPGWEPFVIEGGAGSAKSAGISARAEIKAKRFSGGHVREDRYEALLTAADGSSAALLTALADAFAELPEFQAGDTADDHVILQINLSL